MHWRSRPRCGSSGRRLLCPGESFARTGPPRVRRGRAAARDADAASAPDGAPPRSDVAAASTTTHTKPRPSPTQSNRMPHDTQALGPADRASALLLRVWLRQSPLARERPDRLEHREAVPPVLCRLGQQQVLCDEALEDVQRGARHRLRGAERTAAREHGRPNKHALLPGSEQRIAPFEGGCQRALPGSGRRAAPHRALPGRSVGAPPARTPIAARYGQRPMRSPAAGRRDVGRPPRSPASSPR